MQSCYSLFSCFVFHLLFLVLIKHVACCVVVIVLLAHIGTLTVMLINVYCPCKRIEYVQILALCKRYS